MDIVTETKNSLLVGVIISISTAAGGGAVSAQHFIIYKNLKLQKRFVLCALTEMTDYIIAVLLIALMSRKNRNQMNTGVEEEGFSRCSAERQQGGVTRLTCLLREHQLKAYNWIVMWR